MLRCYHLAIASWAMLISSVALAKPPAAPPIESEPACTWSKASKTEWLCKGHFKLARGEGDPKHIGHCGTTFKAGTVVVTSLKVQMFSPDAKSPFYIAALFLNRQDPTATVIGGTFRSDVEHPEDVFCDFSATIRVQ